MSHQQAHSDGNASSRGPLPSTDHGAVSTAAAHENQRGPGSVVSIPALCNDPLPGTEEPEDNRRSKLPSGGARAWSTDFDARNIGDGDRTSESPSPPMTLLIGSACVCVVNPSVDRLLGLQVWGGNADPEIGVPAAGARARGKQRAWAA